MPSLKTRRLQKGLSQRRLARRAGVAYKTIQLLEAGGHDARFSTLKKLAKALDLPDPTALLVKDTPGAGPPAAEAAARMRDEGPRAWKSWLFELVDAFRRKPGLNLLARAPDPDVPARPLALIASTVEALCAERRLTPPWWCLGVPALKDPWFPADSENLKATALVESPAAFRKREIFVLGNFLKRA